MECNQGHIGAETCPKAGDDPTIYAYRANAECARLANTVVWRVVALTKGQTDWPFDDLVLLDEWFDKLEPVLPPQTKEAVQ